MRVNCTIYFTLLSLCISTARAQAPDPFTPKQHQLVEQVSTIFENSSSEFQYGYIEDIDDGAGITAGRVGFNNSSLFEFVQKYTQLQPNNILVKYLSCLQFIAEHGPAYECLFPSVPKEFLKTKIFKRTKLREYDFGKDFVTAAEDPIMRQTQDHMVEHNIYQPTIEWFHRLHLKTAVGFLIIYDSILQQGIDATQGLMVMLRLSPPWNGNEYKWLKAYLRVRKSVQKHPFYPDGKRRYKVAPYTCYQRSDSLMEILKSKNMNLQPPLLFKYFDEQFELK